MTRMTRYVLTELTRIFLLTVFGLTLVVLLVVVGHEAIRHGLGPVPVIRLIPYLVPNALLFAVPGAVLFAACCVFGNMSASNEVAALKSLGIPPSVLLWPTFATGFFLSLFVVWLNDIAVSWGRLGADRVILHSLEEIVYGMLQTKRSYVGSRFSITVKRVDNRKLIRPTLTFFGKDSERPVIVTARTAELRINPVEDAIVIRLTDSEGEFGENVYGSDPDTLEYNIPLTAVSRKGESSLGPSYTPLARIPAERELQRAAVSELEKTCAAEAAIQLLTGDLKGLTSPAWEQRLNGVTFAMTKLQRLHTEPWRRWANGFSCFFFLLVGAPLAIRMRTADMWTTFFLCFTPILLVYYPLLMYGVERAKQGALPPYAVWLGNLVLFAVGTALIRRVVRY